MIYLNYYLIQFIQFKFHEIYLKFSCTHLQFGLINFGIQHNWNPVEFISNSVSFILNLIKIHLIINLILF